MANGIYEIIDNTVEKMRVFIPTEIQSITNVPSTEDQGLNIVDNTLIVTLLESRYNYKLGAVEIRREYDLLFATKYFALESSRAAQKWAFTVLEDIILYLSLPDNDVVKYLNQTEALSYDKTFNITVQPTRDKFSSDAEFVLTLYGDIKLDGVALPLEKITKSLYDELHGFVEDHEIV